MYGIGYIQILFCWDSSCSSKKADFGSLLQVRKILFLLEVVIACARKEHNYESRNIKSF